MIEQRVLSSITHVPSCGIRRYDNGHGKASSAVSRQAADNWKYLQSLDEILFTNIDVTSAQFAYGLINMGKSPAAGRRLYDEVSTVAVEEDEIDSYARKDDTFLHKMYLEILRSNPPICSFALPLH